MLKLRSPIQITARTEYPFASEAFYQRMIGSYSLMETSVSGEDLLHLSQTPPEIYVMEGEGISNLVNSNTRNEVNLKKVEILNNVLNRIVVSANANLSYQDRVFVTDALYKLGIRDDRKFMSSFYKMAEETRNLNTLIDLYLSRGEHLQRVIENDRLRIESEKETQADHTETERENYLYERIFQRLKTGAVYQIVTNFNRSYEPDMIENNEYSISNQTYTAQHILLSVLRKQTGVGADRLIFRNGNIYEENIENGDTDVTNVKNEITAAVLTDMLKNIYHTGFERFDVRNNTYYRFDDTFFRSSEQTFDRIENTSNVSIYNGSYFEGDINEQSNIEQSEINLLNESTSYTSDEELLRITEAVNELNRQNIIRRQQITRAYERIREHVRRSAGGSGLQQTREDAALALTSPEALRDKLIEREMQTEIREKEMITMMRGIVPDSSIEILELVNNYIEHPEEYRGADSVIRPASIGELMQDIRAAQPDEEVQIPDTPEGFTPEELAFPRRGSDTIIHRTVDENGDVIYDDRVRPGADVTYRETLDLPSRETTEELLENTRRIKRELKNRTESRTLGENIHRSSRQDQTYEDEVQMIHRKNETLSEEELNEQLSLMSSELKTQVKKEVKTEIQTETHTQEIKAINNEEHKSVMPSAYDLNRLIEDGVRSQMNTISDQVLGKLERQMKNEKKRRGF